MRMIAVGPSEDWWGLNELMHIEILKTVGGPWNTQYMLVIIIHTVFCLFLS